MTAVTCVYKVESPHTITQHSVSGLTKFAADQWSSSGLDWFGARLSTIQDFGCELTLPLYLLQLKFELSETAL
jgi:hypothetical protein